MNKENKTQELKFHGIDWWSRPVYIWEEKNLYFGSVDVLVNSIEEAKEKVTENDICYFGTTFDEDDPMGNPISAKKIKLIYE